MRRFPPAGPGAINVEMARLLANYQADLPEKLRTLRDALRAARASSENQLLRDAARDLAHTLRGSAGCHGALAVGRFAGRIEDLLVAMGDARQPADPSSAWAEVDRALEQALAATADQLPFA